MSYETETKQETGCGIIVTNIKIENEVLKQYHKEVANG